MKKIDFNYGEYVYSEVLDNGISVYMYPTDKSKNFYVTVSTYYGAEVSKYKKDNEVYEVTKGSAHFLEHRVMDFTKNKKAMEEINKLGSIANAYTTYNGTNYNIFGSNDIIKNIDILFDRVFKAKIKKSDVENERGIILEEYNMYKDDPLFEAETTLIKNVFSNSFIKDLVIGTEEGILNVTSEELNRLYKDFYTPSNMFIVVCGNFDKESVLNHIKEYMKSVKGSEYNIKVLTEKENYKVNASYEEILKNVVEPKVVIGYKFKHDGLSKLDSNIIFNAMLTENFSKTGKSYLRLLNEGLGRFSYYAEVVNDYVLISFTASSNKYDKFISIIDEELSNLEFTSEALERKKRGLISAIILSFEDIMNVEEGITTNLLGYKELYNNMEDKIKSLNIKDFDLARSMIDINNKSVLVMKK